MTHTPILIVLGFIFGGCLAWACARWQYRKLIASDAKRLEAEKQVEALRWKAEHSEGQYQEENRKRLAAMAEIRELRSKLNDEQTKRERTNAELDACQANMFKSDNLSGIFLEHATFISGRFETAMVDNAALVSKSIDARIDKLQDEIVRAIRAATVITNSTARMKKK